MQLNEITFAGFVGKDAEVKTVGNNLKVGTFSLCHTEKGRDGKEDTTTWVRVTAWGNWADTAGTFKKGDNVVVKGKLNVKQFKHEGVERTSVDVVANAIGRIQKEAPKAQASASKPADDFEMPF